MINQRVMHPAEGSVFEIKGTLDMRDPNRRAARARAAGRCSPTPRSRPGCGRDIHVVAATVGEDEHSVGMREILDIKHGGIERYGFHCHYLGTSVPVERLLDAAEQTAPARC